MTERGQNSPDFGVVVPIRNEAATLPETLPKLMEEVRRTGARLICVCNNCTDSSADIVRQIAGTSATIIETDRPGKTVALQMGDEQLGDVFPRLYIDADVFVEPGAFDAVLKPLLAGQADHVAMQGQHRTDGASLVSSAMAATWDALPHAQANGFLGAIGVSRAGRKTFDRWPDILGDDIFLAACIQPERRQVARHAIAFSTPPPNFAGWVQMRRRWLHGEDQLRELGLAPPHVSGQRSALVRRLIHPRHAFGAWAFVAARLIAVWTRRGKSAGWVPNRSA